MDTCSGVLSVKAMGSTHGEDSPYFMGWKAYEQNPYHRVSNSTGIIQMGLAENQLSMDLMQKRVACDFPESEFCRGLLDFQIFQRIALHQDYHGLLHFRQMLAKFMSQVRGMDRVHFNPERMVLCAGATAATELISFCLGNPGEAFLVPTPYYPGLDRDMRWRTGIQLIPVHCKSSNGFQITMDALESAFDDAVARGIRIKGLAIINPSNPLGSSMTRKTLESLLQFITKRNIHLICDEIFSGTVFESLDFVSIAEIMEENNNCLIYKPELVHLIYSLSKDLGIPGFRVGLLYSFNDHVVETARRMSSFCLVSSQTQHLIACLLSDEEFMATYIKENRRRLKERCDELVHRLEDVGVGCLKSDAGLFCWMDLRELCYSDTVEGEIELWNSIIGDARLNISPGSSFHCDEPGWFRICFANLNAEEFRVAVGRLQNFVVQRAIQMVATKDVVHGGIVAAATKDVHVDLLPAEIIPA